MIYYKIPLTDGLDYPAGCVLVCAYTHNGYQYCQFERVSEVGTNWVSITESEFNVRCPEFPEPAPVVAQEVIAISAKMVNHSIVLELPRAVTTGTLVKFDAPCDCTTVTGGIVIEGVTYSVVDANEKVVAGVPGAWVSGAHVAVIIDKEDGFAYIQGTVPLPNLLATSPLFLVEGRDYGDSVPSNLAKGQIYWVKVVK